ncbi:hypothetical protein ACWEKM_02900 [Streptomyces sp. NPDC004752]
MLAKAGFTRTTDFQGRADADPVAYPVPEIQRAPAPGLVGGDPADGD